MARIKYWNESSQAWEYADKALKIDNNLLIDKTLTIEGKAADAKAVGDAIANIDIPSIDGLASTNYVDTKVASMVDSAPETLNTLNELAAALGDDPNFATTVATQIGEKADKTHKHTASEVGALPVTTTIPSKLSDLTADSTHRTVTDTEKSAWNEKANVSDIPTDSHINSLIDAKLAEIANAEEVAF